MLTFVEDLGESRRPPRSRSITQVQLTGGYAFQGIRSFVRRRKSRYVHHRLTGRRVAGS